MMILTGTKVPVKSFTDLGFGHSLDKLKVCLKRGFMLLFNATKVAIY